MTEEKNVSIPILVLFACYVNLYYVLVVLFPILYHILFVQYSKVGGHEAGSHPIIAGLQKLTPFCTLK